MHLILKLGAKSRNKINSMANLFLSPTFLEYFFDVIPYDRETWINIINVCKIWEKISTNVFESRMELVATNIYILESGKGINNSINLHNFPKKDKFTIEQEIDDKKDSEIIRFISRMNVKFQTNKEV